MNKHIKSYLLKLHTAFSEEVAEQVSLLSSELYCAWVEKRRVYICGNGGSAGNAIHLANDFNYGIDKNTGIGLRIEALPANSSVLTCIANDEGYEHVFSQPLKVKADKDDVLIALSGSGNSPNILKALQTGNQIGMKTFAILGFTGGQAKEIAQIPIHFEVNDMQVAEDLQLIVGHILMQELCEKGLKR